MRIMATAGTMENLEEQIRESGNNYDLDAIRRAYEFAKKAHDGQMRRSGQPYIIHPVCVAGILVELGMDTDSMWWRIPPWSSRISAADSGPASPAW